MIKKTISYKFIPAVVTMLGACSAQALNWQFSLNLPLSTPRHHYEPCPSINLGYSSVSARPCSSFSGLLTSIEQDFVQASKHMDYAYSEDIRRLEPLMHKISRNWFSWATSYRATCGVYQSELELIKARSSEIAHLLRKLRHTNVYLNSCEYAQLHDNLRSLASLVSSCGCYCHDDIHMITMHLSQIQHILAYI